MSDEHRVNEDQQNNAQKRGYVPPKLVCYGRVRDLTQAGTGSQSEFSFLGGLIKNCASNRISIKANRISIKACASDRNAKENILRIGDHPLGIGLYLFDYKPEFRDAWGHGRQFGVMAQEVETVMPEAVSTHQDGYKMVDYAMLGITH